MKRLNVFMLLLSFSLTAFSSVDDKYFTISSVQLKSDGVVIKEVNLNEESPSAMDPIFLAQGLPEEDGFNKSGDLGQVLAAVDQIIALGEKIYKIIEKGRPVLQTSYAPISVLPKGADGNPVDMFDTAGWSRPVSKSYSVEYKNLYGMSVVKFVFTLVYSYGGSYNDKGKFITAAQIIPANVEVAWGYNVSATMALDSVMNHGSKVDPVAGVNLRMNYRISTVVKEEERNLMFYIAGDGQSKMY